MQWRILDEDGGRVNKITNVRQPIYYTLARILTFCLNMSISTAGNP